MKVIIRVSNTQNNQEDLAITPYLFFAHSDDNRDLDGFYGLGMCWGYLACCIGFSKGSYPGLPFYEY